METRWLREGSTREVTSEWLRPDKVLGHQAASAKTKAGCGTRRLNTLFLGSSHKSSHKSHLPMGRLSSVLTTPLTAAFALRLATIEMLPPLPFTVPAAPAPAAALGEGGTRGAEWLPPSAPRPHAVPPLPTDRTSPMR